MNSKSLFLAGVIGLGSLFPAAPFASAQGTTFTYQGRLMADGQPATGVYDLTFALFNAATGGSQVGGTITATAAGVTNGLFTVGLDFGGNFPGADRWLEIGVRANGGGTFTLLVPRQPLTSTPYAVTAANLSGGLAAVQLSGTVPPAQMGKFTNHSDVVVAGLAAAQVLVYSGSVWTNGPLPSASFASNAPPVSLSYSGTNVPVNAALGCHFRLVATNNFLLGNPTGASDGQRIVFEVIQDATGGRTLTLGSAFRLGTDISAVNLTPTANRRDFLTGVYSGTNFYVLGLVKGY